MQVVYVVLTSQNDWKQILVWDIYSSFKQQFFKLKITDSTQKRLQTKKMVIDIVVQYRFSNRNYADYLFVFFQSVFSLKTKYHWAASERHISNLNRSFKSGKKLIEGTIF